MFIEEQEELTKEIHISNNITFKNGTRYWMKNGDYHRLDGPAIEYADGTKKYWIEGKEFSEKEFLEQIKIYI